MMSKLHLTALAALLAASVLPATAQDFVPKETRATGNIRLLDPEFNQAKGLLTWVDMIDGSIWIGGFNKTTGALEPADGRLKLVEKSAYPYGGLGFSLNGPEWVLGGATDRIVYTRQIAGLEPTPENAELGAAFQRASDGKWVTRTVAPGFHRSAPFGSEIEGDPRPRISYNDELGNHYWRELDDASTEELLPGLAPGLLPAVRHVRGSGERGMAYPALVAGVPQVHHYDVDTKVFTQITDEPGIKEQAWMWRAPDFGDDLVMLTTIDKTTLGLYQRVTQGDGTLRWTRVRTLAAPEGGRIFSTEPFVYGGKSYTLLQVFVGDYPQAIWLFDFDETAPIQRRLTPRLPDRARADPEIVFTANGPIVYFSRFNQTKGAYWLCVPCAEGLYRANTGIAVSPTGH